MNIVKSSSDIADLIDAETEILLFSQASLDNMAERMNMLFLKFLVN